MVVRDTRSRDLVEEKLKEDDDGGVYIVGVHNPLSEIDGSQWRSWGTWQPFPTKISGDRKVERPNAKTDKIMKFISFMTRDVRKKCASDQVAYS